MSFFTDQAVRLLSIFLLTAAASGLVGCKRDPNLTGISGQSINAPLESDPNRAYQILSVTFTGIPFENVTIDQQKRVITVNVPASFTNSALNPSVTLTPNTRLVNGLGSDRPFRIESFCYCGGTVAASISPVASTTSQNLVRYTVLARSVAPLEFRSGSSLPDIPLSENTTIALPVSNLYGSSPIVRAYAQPSGSTTPLLIQGNSTTSGGCVWFSCDTTRSSTLTFSFSPENQPALTPGTYTLILEQEDGRRLSFPQPVRFVRGTPRLNVNANFGYQITTGETAIVLQGNNLYTDEISGKLTAASGQTWPLLPATGSVSNGTSLTLAVPNNLPPGSYGLQLLSKGTVYTECIRFSVRRTATQPLIYSLTQSTQATCLATQPVTVQRGVRQSVVISYPGTASLVLKLTSTTVPDRVYQVPVTIPIEAFPRYTLPDSVAPGSYRVTLVATVNGQPVESEPFEQPILVP